MSGIEGVALIALVGLAMTWAEHRIERDCLSVGAKRRGAQRRLKREIDRH